MIPITIVASLTLFASFVCSLFEAGLYSISASQIELLRERGVRGARRLARLREDVEEPIAAILTINTIAHTIGAAWCGAMVGERYGSTAVGVFAAVFTILVLTMTEIVPKSLGVRYAKQLGPRIAGPIQWMIWSTWPLVQIVKRMMRSVGGATGPPTPSEDEVLVLSRLAARGGTVRAEEQRWVQNALRLDRFTAGDLRTPRTVVETLAGDTPVARIVAGIESWVHSRVPITDGDHPDRVIGLVHRREVLDAALRRPDDGLLVRDLLRPIRFVPESHGGPRAARALHRRPQPHDRPWPTSTAASRASSRLEDVLECLLGARRSSTSTTRSRTCRRSPSSANRDRLDRAVAGEDEAAEADGGPVESS